MSLRRFTFAALALPLAMLVPCAAYAGTGARNANSVTREHAPSTTLVPAVIVCAAIGATVARMNRRGGPR